MQLTVKTLKGGKFVVNADPSSTVADVKVIIEAEKAELPAASMKLIHSGKILKDADSIESCNLKPNDFLVVMITKAKKVTAPPAAAASITSETTAMGAVSATEASTSSTTSISDTPSVPALASTSDDFPAEVVSNLIGMGFHEADVRACLRAADGSSVVAVEFLMNGIPSNTAATVSTPGTSAPGTEPLEVLRSHPQFNALRRLVQSNPQTLQAVLTQIGQQQPELLQAINSNQDVFIQMMNEPVDEEIPALASTASTTARAPPAPSGGVSAGEFPFSIFEGMSNSTQMAQMLQSMGPAERQSMATMVGLTPEQLDATAQVISQMPSEQFQDYMNMAMQGGSSSGLIEELRGGGDSQVLRLNDEELAAVDRLADMGFDRAEAAQAYLACDKNEALAANLLMDGGFGFGDDMGDSGNGPNNGDDGGDDIYD